MREFYYDKQEKVEPPVQNVFLLILCLAGQDREMDKEGCSCSCDLKKEGGSWS